jgi:hypothetical protein
MISFACLFLFIQARGQTLVAQLNELHDQIEQTFVELETFENLRQHEVVAIPKRLEVVIYLFLCLLKVTQEI